MAEFLVAVADFDARRLWEELGYSSLFTFLHRELGLSKGAAFYRKTAAELVQRVPEIVGPLEDGRLCVTNIVELAKVLTPENRDEVLPRFFHRSKDEAREIVAELKPVEHAPLRDVVTALSAPLALPTEPALKAPATADPVACATARGLPANLLDANILAPNVNAPTSRVERDSIDPLTAELRRLHITVSRRFVAKLEAARDALSHSHPGANMGELLEAALDLVLAQSAKRKGLVEKPRRERRPAKFDHIPAEVKRAVWVRDGGCCQWAVHGGGICGSRYRVQLDHIHPKALGGESSVDNVRLLCGRHNLFAARLALGDAWMDRYTKRKVATHPAAGPP